MQKSSELLTCEVQTKCQALLHCISQQYEAGIMIST